MRRDAYDLEITCASDLALDAFKSGINCALRLDQPGIHQLTQAIHADPEFALAHAALARQLSIHGFHQESASHATKARELSSDANKREKHAIAVIVAATRFEPEALLLALNHMQQFPRDVFVFSHLLGPFGLLAFSGERNWREQNVDLLEQTKNAYSSDDWWYKTTLAFMCAETGDLERARLLGERAWQIHKNGNCAHTLTHIHFEERAIKEGQTFIQEWCSTYGKNSDMRHHLVWHSTLLSLALGDCENLLDVYRAELDATVCDPMPLATLSDNASLLWRCVLKGVPVPSEISLDVLRYAEAKYPNTGFPFADIHRGMLVALQTKEKRKEFLTSLANDGGTVSEYTKAFIAFVECNYQAVVRCLKPILRDSVKLGGSNPQRHVIEETYLEACIRAKQ